MKGRDLKQIMDRFELTQQALADQLGVARNTVNRWANDLEPIPDAIEIAVKSLKLSAKKGKTHWIYGRGSLLFLIPCGVTCGLSM